jgi:adenylosuccinate synthase
MQDLLDPQGFREHVRAARLAHSAVMAKTYGQDVSTLEAECERYIEAAESLLPYVEDTFRYLQQALAARRAVLFEGAQGTMLDLDHGTYPYVTSSNPVAGYACVGSGVGPTQIEDVWGISKAYATRVGEGPFPTELTDDVGVSLRELGHEYGTTTGRQRRCGWLDLVALRYAVQVNGMTGLALTKLDVLNQMDEIKVCVAYTYRGERLDDMPAYQAAFRDVEPVYQTLSGWKTDLTGATDVKDLPLEARNYVHFIETQVMVPVVLVSVGPRREQTIRIQPV